MIDRTPYHLRNKPKTQAETTRVMHEIFCSSLIIRNRQETPPPVQDPEPEIISVEVDHDLIQVMPDYE